MRIKDFRRCKYITSNVSPDNQEVLKKYKLKPIELLTAHMFLTGDEIQNKMDKQWSLSYTSDTRDSRIPVDFENYACKSSFGDRVEAKRQIWLQTLGLEFFE